MATNPNSNLNIYDYYNRAPKYIIRDRGGNLYHLDNGFFNNEAGIGSAIQDGTTHANGWKFSGVYYNGNRENIWNTTYKVDASNYDNQDTNAKISTNNDNNANDWDEIKDLNALGALPGYDKLSSGENSSDSKGNTSKYVVARVITSGRDNFHFALYKRKDSVLDFLKSLRDAPGSNKEALARMATHGCDNIDNRYNEICNIGCGNDLKDGNGQRICYDGLRDKCKTDMNSYNTPSYNSTDPFGAGRCLQPIQDGSMNDELFNGCSRTDRLNTPFCQNITNLGNDNLKGRLRDWTYSNCNNGNQKTDFCKPYLKDKFDDAILGTCIRDNNGNTIGNQFCTDVRKELGNDSLKTKLNEQYYNIYCITDDNINKAECVDFRTTCSDVNQLVKNNAPFNCNTGIKKLNDANKIMMTKNINIKTPPTGIDPTWMIKEFNNPSTNAVTDALCTLATNSGEKACQDYLGSNFSALVNKVSTDNPILIMYFSGGIDLKNKAGMDSYNSSEIKFKATNDSNLKVGFNSPQISLPPPWSAKIYTYITPSTTGDYLFRASADDLIKVYLNNNLIINNWDGSRTEFSTYITLDPTKGPYLLYAEFGDTGGAAIVNIRYTTREAIITANNVMANAVFKNFDILPPNTPVSGASPLPGVGTNSLFMSQFSPYNLVANAKKAQSIKYCSTNNRFATDKFCTGDLASNYRGVNSAYTGIDGTFTGDPVYIKSMIDYCTVDNKFTTDPFCLGDVNLDNDYINGVNKNPNLYDSNNTSITTAIDNFCKAEINNTYSTANKGWCKTNDNLNNKNYNNKNLQSLRPEYVDQLRKTRLKYNQDAISKSAKSDGSLTQDVIDYISTDYIDLQTNGGADKFPDSNIVTPDLLSFCENSDPTLKTPLCDNIYNSSKYKMGTNVIASKARIDDNANCIDNKAFMGKSGDALKDASCMLKRDAPATYARYLPLAIKYCGTGDNIVSPECTTYYNNVQGNINNAMNAVYTSGGKAPFTNKESFRGGNCNDEDSNSEDCKSCDDSYDWTFLFILFICFVLVLSCISSYSRCKKNKHAQFQSPFPLQVKLESL